MAVQDDVREREMRTLFNLVRPEEYGRGDIDAVLELEGSAVPEDLDGQTSARPSAPRPSDRGRRPGSGLYREIHRRVYETSGWLGMIGPVSISGTDMQIQVLLAGVPEEEVEPLLEAVADLMVDRGFAEGRSIVTYGPYEWPRYPAGGFEEYLENAWGALIPSGDAAVESTN